MAIQSIGVGSGLPLQDLLDNLRASENVALTAISSRQKQQESRISAYGRLQASLEKLQSFSEKLSGSALFGDLKPKVGGTGFTATSTNKAIEGKYNIQVIDLARTQTLVSAGRSDKAAAIGDVALGGQIAITIDGVEKTINLAAGKTSLVDVAAAINADKDLGVRATIMNDGSGAAPYRLMLSASESGVKANVTDLAVTGNSDLQDAIGFSTLTVQAGQNAKISLDGMIVTSQSNTFENVLEGVTINLLSTTEKAESLDLTRNDDAAMEVIKGFVEAYNDLQKTIKSVTAFDVTAQTKSALTGDSVARNVQSKMSQLMSTRVGDGAIQTLADIGITTDFKTGQLIIKEDKLKAALNNDLSSVTELIQGENGVGARIDKLSKLFLDKTEGTFVTVIEGARTSLEGLASLYDMTADRIDQKMEAYRKQFTSLDTLVSQMNSMSSYLSQQLASLNFNSNR